MSNQFRDLLFPLDHPHLADVRGLDPRRFGQAAISHPILEPIVAAWRTKLAEPFHGLTCDGRCRHGLFKLGDEGAPTQAMCKAAAHLLDSLDPALVDKLRHPIDALQWRVWGNPEFLWNDYGLRLEELSAEERGAVLEIVRASLSPKGYEKTRDCMRMNAFLGELTQLSGLMNEYSYNFLLFGRPSLTEPWGWSLYGHHLVLNCFVLGGQMVISPTFMGAEPNRIDTGPRAGLTLFRDEEAVGLELMRSLSPDLFDRARIYPTMKDPAMPEGRWHAADERHLGGAFQDNRIVPYEGIVATDMDQAQRQKLVRLAAAFLEYLPEGPLSAKLAQIEQHLGETHWSWIGGTGDEDPFYYRIQSPVVMIEFDHHSGVWLSNQTPAKCHIHTVVRTPNGNDYGRDLLAQHYANTHPGQRPGED